MPRSPSIPAPNELLCEKCGYPIGHIEGWKRCPECGTRFRDSYPDTREGSVWQQRDGNGRWLWTNIETLWRPRYAMRRIRIDRRSSAFLMHANLMVAATMNAIGWLYASSAQINPAMFLWLGVYGGILLLIFIETIGVRFYARADSRRWRVTPDVAWVVCHHASVGWVIGGILMLFVWVADPVRPLIYSEAADKLTLKHLGVSISTYSTELRLAQLLIPFATGMLIFETLVFFGVRQCRFANTPASATQQGPQ